MKKLLVALLATGGLLASSAPAFATPILRLSSGASSVTVVDGGANDIVAGAGAVGFAGSVGDFSLSVTTGLTKPYLGTAELPELDLNSVSASSSAGGTLKLELTETDYMAISDMVGFLKQIGGTISNIAGSSLTYKVFVDVANTAFGTATEIYSSVFQSGAFSDTAWDFAALTAGSPYSITVVAELTHGVGYGNQVSSFDGYTAVPEPATVALLGLGLLGAGLARRRRAGVKA